MISIDPGFPAGGIDDPFRVRFFDGVIETSVFAELLAAFPAEGMVPIGAAGHKITFNSRNEAFPAFMDRNPRWRDFHAELVGNFSRMCGDVLGVSGGDHARFEFSSLPGDDGGLYPHTDTPGKLATAVIFMELDWNPAWGGGFEALRHRSEPDADFTGKRPVWAEVETVLTVPVAPRRMLFMQRTNNSLHGVRPLRAPRPRRSVTINLMGGAS